MSFTIKDRLSELFEYCKKEDAKINVVKSIVHELEGLTSSLLSEREVEVYDLMIDGKTNIDIADILFITDKTVKYHITSIFKKLRVKSRSELIVDHYKNELRKAREELSTIKNVE